MGITAEYLQLKRVSVDRKVSQKKLSKIKNGKTKEWTIKRERKRQRGYSEIDLTLFGRWGQRRCGDLPRATQNSWVRSASGARSVSCLTPSSLSVPHGTSLVPVFSESLFKDSEDSSFSELILQVIEEDTKWLQIEGCGVLIFLSFPKLN